MINAAKTLDREVAVLDLGSSIRYGGLCGQSTLTDGMIRGNFHLTDEQLEAIASDVKEQDRNDHESSEANIKAAKEILLRHPRRFLLSTRFLLSAPALSS